MAQSNTIAWLVFIVTIVIAPWVAMLIVTRPIRLRQRFDRVVATGNVERVQQFIAQHPTVLTWMPKSASSVSLPLHDAARDRNLVAARVLLAAGVDPNGADRHGRTPLERAASPSLHNEPDATRKMIEVLLAGGAEINPKNSRSTALHDAVRIETVRLLLERGANPNARDEHGRTPLHEAALAWDQAPIRLLVEHGAVVNVRDHAGNTPIEEAMREYLLFGGGMVEWVHLMIELGANVDHLDDAAIDRLNEYPRAKKIENEAEVAELRRIVAEAKSRKDIHE